jgi:hypothetical protein
MVAQTRIEATTHLANATTTQAARATDEATWTGRLAQRPGVTVTVYGCGHAQERYSSADLDRAPAERLTDGGALCPDCARRLEEDR